MTIEVQLMIVMVVMTAAAAAADAAAAAVYMYLYVMFYMCGNGVMVGDGCWGGSSPLPFSANV